MSVYKKMASIGSRFFSKSTLFKYGFNYSPMYRRSTAKILTISDDLLRVTVQLPISYKNRNYVNSIFGGSMFAAVDPIPMIQLINLLGDDYVVWDKSAEIYFKKPAKEDLYADFYRAASELVEIKSRIVVENEIEITKTTQLTSLSRSIVYCEVVKTIYIASKSFYNEKKRLKNRN